MRINIISIGKTKAGFISEGVQEYLKRLRHYIKIEWIEIPASKRSKTLECKGLLEYEAENIKARCHPRSLRVALAENGKELTSQGFSEWIGHRMIEGTGVIDFIIGSEAGIDTSIIDKADMILSLSKMTFTHQFVRLIFLEQLYRAFTIIRGEPYHHG